MSGPYFTVEKLMREAESLAGASNWGTDEFREPLAVFIDSLNREGELSKEGVRRTHSHMVKTLAARLGLFRCYDEYPQIADEEIVAPIFVTGQVRTGTSFTNALMASNPAHSAPLQWQTFFPYPPCNMTGIDHSAEIEKGAFTLRDEGWQDPELRMRHSFENCEPAEDTHIQDLSFISLSYPFFWHVPGYGDWLQVADYSHPYRMIKLFVKMLQFKGRKVDRWVLKCPLHLQQLDHLFAAFPDASIIVTHRDPVKSVGSIFGLLHAHRSQFGNAQTEPDASAMRDIIDGGVYGVSKLMAWRDDPANQQKFVDVFYRDLEHDPLATIEGVYRQLGMDFSDAAREAIQAYVRDNRKGKFGAHRYSLEDYGLNADDIRRKFAAYTERFRVPLGV